MRTKITMLVAAGALLVAPAVASAVDEYGSGPGVKVQGNGGVLSYPGAVADQFDPGATYGASVALEPWGALGLELGYQGAAYGLQGADGTLIENGGQALLKVGPELGLLEPYALGGYNLTRVNPNNAAEDAGFAADTIQKVPVGVGVDFDIPVGENPLVLGARGTYNFLFDNEAFGTDSNDRGNDQITGQLMIGGEF